ncbi:MAG: ATP-binding protein [Bacteroidales bacterium]|nr:ATP-binding protein [Bacteroidales bacterium]
MVQRKLFKKLKAHIPKKEFSIISGARQTGKSTLLRQLETYCKQNRIPSVFLNLENRSILGELNENPLNLLKYLPATDERVVVFVDEVQYLSDASNFLKLLFDEHALQIKLVASGSSAFYIDKGFRDSMAGRKKIFYLPTCSFDEYLELGGKLHLLEEMKHLSENPGKKSTLIAYLQMEWESFMIYGGYPAIITEPYPENKIDMLKELRDSYVKRDILESGIINEAAFYNLFRILATQIGSLVNINELASTLRVKNETVSSHLIIMQKCFHIALVKPFFRNLRKELVKMPKVYLLDTGLRNCLLNNFQTVSQRADKGELWENTVYKILLDKYDRDEIHFWRTSAGNEVDFVLPGIIHPLAIEAKFDKNQIKENKYKLFRQTYPEIAFNLTWMHPFGEDFFQRIG